MVLPVIRRLVLKPCSVTDALCNQEKATSTLNLYFSHLENEGEEETIPKAFFCSHTERCHASVPKSLSKGPSHLSPERKLPVTQDVHNFRLSDVNITEDDSTLGPKTPTGDAVQVKLPNSTQTGSCFHRS